MNTSFLFVLLGLVLLTCLICSICLLCFKDKQRNEKISAIATIVGTIGTIIIGIVTIRLMINDEKRDKMLNQPLFSVQIVSSYSLEDEFIKNEEYTIENVGMKVKSITSIDHFSYLVLSYHETRRSEPIIRYCPLKDYFNYPIQTGFLDGEIAMTAYSGNNNVSYHIFYLETMEYAQIHPDACLYVEKHHLFKVDYVDLYGESHSVVKNERNMDVDAKYVLEVRRKADKDSGGKLFTLQELDLKEILKTCFPEIKAK